MISKLNLANKNDEFIKKYMKVVDFYTIHCFFLMYFVQKVFLGVFTLSGICKSLTEY